MPVLLYRSLQQESGEGGDTLFMNVNEEWEFLKGLESSRAVVPFQMFGQSELVTVRRVEIPEGAVRGFGDDRAYVENTTYVHLMTALEA